MLVKAFPHGKGGGSAPIDYLLRMDYFGRKEKPPEVLRGDPETTRELIDSIDRKWKFTAGVCSWSGEDTVTPEQEIEVMNNFEELAFAGLDLDQYNILWVKHSHANHHELHFVIPRMELSTGNAFNAFPPGWEKDFSHLRDYENVKHDWTRPDEPELKRMFTPNNADIIEARLTRWGQNPNKHEKKKAKDIINEYLKQQVENGLVQDRSDIVTSLREIGFEINRESQKYITVKDTESNQKIRLKGGIYESGWKLEQFSRTNERENKEGASTNRGSSRQQLENFEQELARVIAKRSQYNTQRYGKECQDNDRTTEPRKQAPELDICKSLGTNSPDRDSTIDRDVHRTMAGSGLVSRRSKLKHVQTKQLKDRDKTSTRNPPNTSREDFWNRLNERQRREIHSTTRWCSNENGMDYREERTNKTGVINHEQKRTRKNSNENLGKTKNRTNGDSRGSINKDKNTRRSIERLRKGIDRFEQLVRSLSTTYKRARELFTKNTQVAKNHPKQNSQGYER